jgi:HAD superfamily hydrolase (TIGR01549 family)
VTLRAVLLDAGGVLVNPNWVRVSEALAPRAVALAPEALAAAEPHAKHELDTPAGIRSTNDRSRGWLYFDLVLARAGVTPSDATAEALAEVREYHRVHNLWESVPDEVPGALAALKRLGLPIAVASNSNGTARAKLERLDLARYFDVVVDSHEIGIEKPSPAFFEYMLGQVGATPEETLHVGDFFHIDVVGARSAGLHAWLVDVGGLYADRDCPRFSGLQAVVDAIADRVA